MLSRRLPVAGEALRTGWPPVLALLEAVPGGGDARAVGAAFQAVQLLAADHLAALPLPLLAPSLRVAALYASQQARTLHWCTAGEEVRSALLTCKTIPGRAAAAAARALAARGRAVRVAAGAHPPRVLRQWRNAEHPAYLHVITRPPRRCRCWRLCSVWPRCACCSRPAPSAGAMIHR